MSDDARIQQFRQMAEADPENELGHFSLGKAYFEADRFQDAIAPLARTLELNPRLSKAYQFLGESYERLGQREKAIEIMTEGVRCADAQGDRKPREAMAAKLEAWGAPVPAAPSVASPTVDSTSSEAGFRCSRCGRPNNQLAKPPFKGTLGEKVYHHVCSGCWREWIPMGTKVINELGLALNTQVGQDTYDQYMIEFLQLDQV